MSEKQLRQRIVEACLDMNRLGINQGTSGNISARSGAVMLMTPSSIPYHEMRPAMIAAMPLNAEYGAFKGPCKPSSEWRFHLDIMRARPDVGAIVHTHAMYATILSILRKPIPAVHYMIAAFGGPTITCTDYAPFGTSELSALAVEGLADRNGVLLGNHGMIATGRDLSQAMWRAVELETLARMYFHVMVAGKPVVLPDEEIMRIAERFKDYGYRPANSKSKSKSKGKSLVKTATAKSSSRRSAPRRRKDAASRR
jgi:L-fuculose-phosphate aldolase